MKFIKILFLFLLIFLLCGGNASSYTKTTHKTVNIKSAEISIIFQYVVDQLGIPTGGKTVFLDKNIEQWLGLGGEKEDEPPWRTRNHFHDPLKNRDNAGLNLPASESAAIWAQNTGSDWSWPAAMDYFYQALTASSAAEREQGFADTFRALGQIMHLVEDMSNRLSAVSYQLSAEGVPA